MKHRIFTIVAALSLLLFVAIVALWAARSHVKLPWEIRSPLIHTKFDSRYRFAVNSQTLQFGCEYWSPTSEPMDEITRPGFSTPWQCMGFMWDSGPSSFIGSGASWTPVSQRWTLSIPYWALLVVFAIVPTWWLLAYRRRRLAILRRGHCPICDYDLRASKERCPECGTPIAPANADERMGEAR